MYEMIAGLETHVELNTKTKIFCSCTTGFGGEPNTHCCPVCVGLPGTLPVLNEQAVNYAIKAGLALNCRINPLSKMDRKNYFYPDLPKAYQITQHEKPLCEDGYVRLKSGKTVRIKRIHIEEDAGKLIHENGNTFVDYNRGGVPLIEIVTEPDFRSADEIREYIGKLQLIIRYTGISDVRMQEGSLRCDVNISVRPQGAQTLGTRTEIKNMNSLSFISKALRYEFDRQTALLESGGEVVQETRRFNEKTGKTESMRSKEDAHDYRYFPEPDLVDILVDEQRVEAIRAALPEMPDAREKRYLSEYGIPEPDCANICKYRRISEYFDEVCKYIKTPKTAANLITSHIFKRFPTEADKERFDISVSPEMLAELIELAESGGINSSVVKKTLEKMLDTGRRACELVDESDMSGVGEEELNAVCRRAVEANPKAIADFRGGKQAALMPLVGFVMKETRGRADAARARAVIEKMAGG